MRKLCSRLTYANVTATLGLFFALAGGSAYAINEWNSSNIQNETLLSEDIKNGTLQAEDYGVGSVSGARIQDNNVTTLDLADAAIFSNDVRDESLITQDIKDNSLITQDIKDESLITQDVRDGSLIGLDIANDSLTGADINESSLNLPQTPTTATFAGANPQELSGVFFKVAAKTLPAGSWAVVATANITTHGSTCCTTVRDTACELRNGNNFIGGAIDRRVTPSVEFTTATLSMNGGAQVPAGGGEVSLWCNRQTGSGSSFATLDSGQMMMIRLDGFS